MVYQPLRNSHEIILIINHSCYDKKHILLSVKNKNNNNKFSYYGIFIVNSLILASKPLLQVDANC